LYQRWLPIIDIAQH